MSLPVPYQETFTVHDPTKIQEYMTCERLYFYHFVLGFRPEEPIHNLIFGSAWHDGLEALLNGQTSEEAHAIFLKTYREVYPPQTDMNFRGKSPAHALVGLKKFKKEFSRELEERELLATEIGVSISLGKGRVLYGKMDSIYRDPLRGILSLEHKTTGARFAWWEDHWQLSFQVSTYHLFLMAHFLGEKIYGVIINGAIFYKDRVEFLQVPVNKNINDIEDFLFEANRHFENIERDFNALSECTPDDETMKAFPRRVKNCIQYNRICPMFDLCHAWHNPLRYLDQIPAGYKVNHWDCRKEQVKEKMEVTL